MPNVRLIIDLDADGLKLQGPVNDRVLCYGLLEMAKDAIRQQAAMESVRKVVPVTMIPPPLPNGGRRG